jgi:hypothetical protein
VQTTPPLPKAYNANRSSSHKILTIGPLFFAALSNEEPNTFDATRTNAPGITDETKLGADDE